MRIIALLLALAFADSASGRDYMWRRLPSGKVIVVFEPIVIVKPPPRPDHWQRTREAYFDYHYGRRRGQPIKRPAVESRRGYPFTL